MTLMTIWTAVGEVSPGEAQAAFWDVAQNVLTTLVALGAIYMTLIRPAARALSRKLGEIAAEQASIRKQVHPNSGTSAYDHARRAADGVVELQHAVGRLQADMNENRRRVDSVATEQVATSHKLAELADVVTPLPHRLETLSAQQQELRTRVKRLEER